MHRHGETTTTLHQSPFLKAGIIALCVAAGPAAKAELQGLTETELSEIDGAGIGLVLEDFKFAHGTDVQNGRVFKIGGIKSSQGEDVEIVVNKLYISGSGSNYGQTLGSVNLGRLVNPFTIDVVDGNDIGVQDKAVLSIAAPTKVAATEGYNCMGGGGAGSGVCSSRPSTATFVGERPDIGLQMNVTVGSNQSSNLNIHAQSAVIDGSYLRLWGDNDRRQLVGQFKLNFYTPELSINACEQDGTNCGSRIRMSDFALELALGNEFQPMFLDVDGSGNFVAEIQAIQKPAPGTIGADGLRSSSDPATWDFYNDYYTNPEYRSNLTIGNFSVGNRDFGSARVEGMLIQHLKIQTKDLAP
ncbi:MULTISPECIES: hypothetical protein [Marinobacter]|uniref:hypothetical protein n=1 Tax=Marinobacter TaxID=2742 RepID=UPI001D099A51|nr:MULTISPECIES: hypothetical protein [Marinobacter]MCK7568429.1 hypothetical protein [Marinobacter xestospongiae]UDL04578.1 hypothetical protein J2887_18150 [Marinobacter sp. CA1]